MKASIAPTAPESVPSTSSWHDPRKAHAVKVEPSRSLRVLASRSLEWTNLRSSLRSWSEPVSLGSHLLCLLSSLVHTLSPAFLVSCSNLASGHTCGRSREKGGRTEMGLSHRQCWCWRWDRMISSSLDMVARPALGVGAGPSVLHRFRSPADREQGDLFPPPAPASASASAGAGAATLGLAFAMSPDPLLGNVIARAAPSPPSTSPPSAVPSFASASRLLAVSCIPAATRWSLISKKSSRCGYAMRVFLTTSCLSILCRAERLSCPAPSAARSLPVRLEIRPRASALNPPPPGPLCTLVAGSLSISLSKCGTCSLCSTWAIEGSLARPLSARRESQLISLDLSRSWHLLRSKSSSTRMPLLPLTRSRDLSYAGPTDASRHRPPRQLASASSRALGTQTRWTKTCSAPEATFGSAWDRYLAAESSRASTASCCVDPERRRDGAVCATWAWLLRLRVTILSTSSAETTVSEW